MNDSADPSLIIPAVPMLMTLLFIALHEWKKKPRWLTEPRLDRLAKWTLMPVIYAFYAFLILVQLVLGACVLGLAFQTVRDLLFR